MIFKGHVGPKNYLNLLKITSSGKEVCIEPCIRPVGNEMKISAHGWGDNFNNIDQVHQTAFDILACVYNEQVAAVFCKRFATEFLIDCGTTFELNSSQIKNWFEATMNKDIAA